MYPLGIPVELFRKRVWLFYRKENVFYFFTNLESVQLGTNTEQKRQWSEVAFSICFVFCSCAEMKLTYMVHSVLEMLIFLWWLYFSTLRWNDSTLMSLEEHDVIIIKRL